MPTQTFRAARLGGQCRKRMPGIEGVGILGLGALGRTTARRLRPFGFAFERLEPDAEKGAGRGVLSREWTRCVDFLRGSEILICLLPLTSETRGVLNEKTFGQLPRGAYLINCARGALVVEADLLAALDSGKLSGCGAGRLPRGAPAAGQPPVDSPQSADHTPRFQPDGARDGGAHAGRPGASRPTGRDAPMPGGSGRAVLSPLPAREREPLWIDLALLPPGREEAGRGRTRGEEPS